MCNSPCFEWSFPIVSLLWLRELVHLSLTVAHHIQFRGIKRQIPQVPQTHARHLARDSRSLWCFNTERSKEKRLSLDLTSGWSAVDEDVKRSEELEERSFSPAPFSITAAPYWTRATSTQDSRWTEQKSFRYRHTSSVDSSQSFSDMLNHLIKYASICNIS